MPTGTRRGGGFHDRHARRTVHAYACPANIFEPDFLLLSDAHTRVGGPHLHGLVDDVIYWGLDETDMLDTLDVILERLGDAA